MGCETGGRVGCFAALAEELEHGGAGVYGDSLEARVYRQERGGEAAVPIPEDEGLFAVEEEREEVGAAALEGAAESEVFEPAIGFGDEVEVGLAGLHGCWLEWYWVDGVSCFARCPLMR